MTIPSPITRDAETDLHLRLLDNDATASSDFVSAFLGDLIEHLRRINPKIEVAFCIDAAQDAILALIKNPSSFRAGESLWAYLCMSAQGDVKNALAKEKRRRGRTISLTFVEHVESGGNYPSNDRDPVQLAIAAEEDKDLETRILPCVRRGLSDEESKALDLLLEGERRTEAFASALGIMDKPKANQKAIVKRVKDKLKIRLKRCQEDI